MKVIGLGGNPALNEKIAAILHQPLIETAVHRTTIKIRIAFAYDTAIEVQVIA